MRLNEVHPAPGSRKPARRAARGQAGYRGKTAGRGMKGQKYRGRGKVRRGFEGTNPMYRQLPTLRGRSNRAHNVGLFRKEFAIVNVSQLEQRFEAGAEVTPAAVLEAGIVSKMGDGLRVLGNGALTKALSIRAHGFSASARAKIEAAGGSVEVIEA